MMVEQQRKWATNGTPTQLLAVWGINEILSPAKTKTQRACPEKFDLIAFAKNSSTVSQMFLGKVRESSVWKLKA